MVPSRDFSKEMFTGALVVLTHRTSSSFLAVISFGVMDSPTFTSTILPVKEDSGNGG
jgi:hypothetical protein